MNLEPWLKFSPPQVITHMAPSVLSEEHAAAVNSLFGVPAVGDDEPAAEVAGGTDRQCMGVQEGIQLNYDNMIDFVACLPSAPLAYLAAGSAEI
jgi:hypothetical protein